MSIVGLKIYLAEALLMRYYVVYLTEIGNRYDAVSVTITTGIIHSISLVGDGMRDHLYGVTIDIEDVVYASC